MLFIVSLFIMNITAQEKGTFKDPRDGKVYRTVELGGQTWMAENLKYGAKGYSNDYPAYGWLYSWDEAQKICPEGWHLPSPDEWKAMIESFGKIYDNEGKIPKKKDVSKEELERINVLYKSIFQALVAGGSSGFDILYAGQQDPDTFQGLSLSDIRTTYSGEGTLTHFWTTEDYGGKSTQLKNIYAVSFHFQKSGKSGIFTDMRLRKRVRSSVRCIYGKPVDAAGHELPEIPADTTGTGS